VIKTCFNIYFVTYGILKMSRYIGVQFVEAYVSIWRKYCLWRPRSGEIDISVQLGAVIIPWKSSRQSLV